ncbi:MAG: thioredoxin-like domain-containing protein [Planctomycetia bacterium]|nr:thioredoxin-like domain-containing protein [Planctomycetia bacterium]
MKKKIYNFTKTGSVFILFLMMAFLMMYPSTATAQRRGRNFRNPTRQVSAKTERLPQKQEQTKKIEQDTPNTDTETPVQEISPTSEMQDKISKKKDESENPKISHPEKETLSKTESSKPEEESQNDESLRKQETGSDETLEVLSENIPDTERASEIPDETKNQEITISEESASVEEPETPEEKTAEISETRDSAISDNDFFSDSETEEVASPEEGPEEFSDSSSEESPEDNFEEVTVIPFEMEGMKRIPMSHLEEVLTLPENPSTENLISFLMDLETYQPDHETENDTKITELFYQRITAAKWQAATTVMQKVTNKECTDPEVCMLAVKSMLEAAFFQPEIYLTQAKEIPDFLRNCGATKEAWKVEEGLLMLDCSLQMRQITGEQDKTDEKRSKLLHKTCLALISHMEKGLNENVATTDDIIALTVSLITYGSSFTPEQKITLFETFYPLAKKQKDIYVRFHGHLMENAVKRLQTQGKPLSASFKTSSGETIKTEDYTGKTLAIYFWSMENDISLQEMSLLLEFHQFYAAKGFEVLGISMDPDTEEIHDFIEDNQLPWKTVVSDSPEDFEEEESFAAYLETPEIKLGILECPTMIILDSSGKVLSAEADLLTLLEILEENYGKFTPSDTDEELDENLEAELEEETSELIEE